MKIAIVGTGYVGLVVGACLAENGNTVVCVDKDESKIRMLVDGKMPIYEPGLEEMVRRNHSEERLRFSTDLPEAVRASEIIFIAVGTAARVHETIAKETTQPFSVVSNPEFLKQGAAIEDFMKPDRVVIGAEDQRAAEVMKELYAPFTRTGAPIMLMDTPSAELSKYAANSILAARISFMNEIANVCELVGADVDQVRKAIGSDRRIGSSFLFPGVGYGGSCFPKDVKALLKSAADKGYDFRILSAVEAVNDAQKSRLVAKMEAHFTTLKGKTIALWGLAFKPRTDDMREAPAVPIIERLLALGASVRAYDPEAAPTARRLFDGRIAVCEKSYEALTGADALAIVTEWNEFREPDFGKMRSLMRAPVVFDGRNIYSPEHMRALGFTYISIGR